METNNTIPRVTPDHIQALIDRTSFVYQLIPGTTITLCIAMLDEKFSLAIGKSACVDPRLFNAAKGQELAYNEALALAKNKLWELEGYRLYHRLREEPEQIAKVAHQVNKAYCESMGDHSQPAWEDAPEWQRTSARLGVEFHLSGNYAPEDSHKYWMAQKDKEGWIYGEVKDPEAKTHPCMVSFDQLPAAQQTKDHLFRGVVHAYKEPSNG